MVHCLFERSNTFRDAFLRAGYEAKSYDIVAGADEICDILREINRYENLQYSIFNNINENDIVMAFFPCTYFSTKNSLWARGESYSQRKWNVLAIIDYAKKNNINRSKYYISLCNLVKIAFIKNFQLIVENPGHDNYLTKYFPRVYEKIDIKDRSKFGDDLKKRTQFLFFNCSPEFRLFNQNESKYNKTIEKTFVFDRSRIKSEFADFFVNTFVPRPL